MDQVPPSPSPSISPGATKSEYSALSIVVAFLLGLTLVLFIHFLISDVTESLYGKRPEEAKAIIVSAMINIPLFLLSIFLFFSRLKSKSAYKLATTTFFISALVSMFSFLVRFGSYVYQINQKLTVYGVSIILIVVFIVSIVYVQEKYKAN